MSSSGKQRFLGILLPILLLLLGGAAIFLFVISREPPPSGERSFPGMLVETVVLESTSETPVLTLNGQVIPAREASLRPEVSGTLVEVSPRLQPGEQFRASDLLARIDPRPFQERLTEARARLGEAEANLRLELGRNKIAEADWEFYRQNLDARPEDDRSSLALREPQLQIAQSRLEAAKAAVGLAELNLEYTRIKAPFDCLVLREEVDLGQLVSPATLVAHVVGIKAFWLQAAVPYRYLEAIDIPGVNAGQGSRVTVSHEQAGSRVEREGEVVRLLGDLDPRGRMARLLVRVDDPLRNATDTDGLPLLLNTYARAKIITNLEGNWIRIPREAIREGDKVYLFRDERLAIRTIDILWRGPDHVLVQDGLSAGDKLVLTNLSTAAEGMKLRETPAGQ